MMARVGGLPLAGRGERWPAAAAAAGDWPWRAGCYCPAGPVAGGPVQPRNSSA